MGAGQHAQGPVSLVGVIEVNADGQHLLEHRDGWLDVGDVLFHAPRAESGDVCAGAERDGEILMSGDEPVRIRGFVEVGRANGEWPGRKMRADHPEDVL